MTETAKYTLQFQNPDYPDQWFSQDADLHLPERGCVGTPDCSRNQWRETVNQNDLSSMLKLATYLNWAWKGMYVHRVILTSEAEQ